MYDEILVPTDGSDPSLVAVDRGIEFAAALDGRVHFLNVVDVGTEMSASAVGTIADDLTETFQEVGAEALEEATSRADEADVDHRRAVLEGVPHDAIEAYSDEAGIDLVVVGESGRSGLMENLLGSTTDRVARTADASVLIARPDDAGTAP